jgi:hypothetical protein
LPTDLQGLTFGYKFKQHGKSDFASWPAEPHFGDEFAQSRENVVLPAGLQTFTSWRNFTQSMANAISPDGLQIRFVGFVLNRAGQRFTF